MIRGIPVSGFKQAGIGLIEILISMFIGLFIMAGVLQMFSTSSQNAVVSSGTSLIQENIRYVFSIISADINQTGNLGCASSSINFRVDNLLESTASGYQPFDFSTVVGGIDFVTGYSGSATSNGSDSFFVRKVDVTNRREVTGILPTGFDVVNTNGLEEDDLVVVAGCSVGAAIFKVTNDPSGGNRLLHAQGASPDTIYNARSENTLTGVNDLVSTNSLKSPVYLYSGSTGVKQYYIGSRSGGGSCGSGTGESIADCALKVRESGGAEQELVEGVHGLQVSYGWTDSSGDLLFANADAVPDWDRVDRVEVTLLFNSVENASPNAAGNIFNAPIVKTVTRTFSIQNQFTNYR